MAHSKTVDSWTEEGNGEERKNKHPK